MTRVLKLFVCFLALAGCLGGTPGNVQAQLQPGIPRDNSVQEMQAKANAQAAAAAWLVLIDNGQYAESWQAGSPYFHTAITQDGWVTLLKGGFPVFGKLVSRNLKQVAYTRILPGAPDGQYVALQYQSDFTNSKGLAETITLALDPTGSWKVAGYYIK